MADTAESARYVRYALSQLRARNGFHVFEEACFHLAKRTVTPDLLPATGPVGAGGDQGRDFETFRGHRGDEAIAFVCTLQAEHVKTKIRRDVEKLTAQGEPVDAVYAFCEADIPVAQRNTIKAAVRQEYGVRLEVLDGQAIASLLAEPDNFWIARRFLEVPDAMAPTAPSGPEWYAAAKARWAERTEPAATWGELDDLRRSGREVVFGDGPPADTEFWLERLRPIADAGGSRLGRSAFYQLAVLSLRGTGSLHGLEAEFDAFFAAVGDLEGEGELEDAQVLLSYVATAARIGQANIDPDKIDQWREALAARLDEELSAATTPGRRCSLLFIRGGLHLVCPGTAAPYSDAALDAALTTWGALVQLSDDAPFFPIDRLGNVVTVIAPALVGRTGYAAFVKALDEKTAARSGQLAAAGAHRDRAMNLYRAGRTLDALDDLHRARVGWMAEDTLRGSLLATMIMIGCYERLGLGMAVKFHALAVAGIALKRGDETVMDLAAQALFVAARSEYEHGNWLAAVELAEVGIILYDNFHHAPWQEDDEHRDGIFMVLFAPYGLAKRFEPAAVPALREALEVHGLLDQLSEPGPWSETTEEEAADQILDQLGAVPFADAGTIRALAWSALGVEWRVSFATDYETALAAERFAAYLQILLVHVAREDLCLLRMPVRVEVTLADITTAVQAPDEDGIVWQLSLRRGVGEGAASVEEVQRETSGAAVALLLGGTVLSDEAADAFLERLASDELFSKLTPGGIYDDLYATVVSRERWDLARRAECHRLGDRDTVVGETSEELGPTLGLGPTYSHAQALEFLANRYDHLTKATALTRLRLAGDPAFVEAVRALRSEGWLDWHIMNAVNSVASNYRARLVARTEEEFRQATRHWLWHVEDDNSPPVPAAQFTVDALREAHLVAGLSCLRTWGLRSRQLVVDPASVDAFLKERYRHYEDDVPHDDPFPAELN